MKYLTGSAILAILVITALGLGIKPAEAQADTKMTVPMLLQDGFEMKAANAHHIYFQKGADLYSCPRSVGRTTTCHKY